MNNKFVIIVLNIVLGIALIPIIWGSVNASKNETFTTVFNLTNTGGTLTSDLTMDQLDLLTQNYDNIISVSDINLKSLYTWDLPISKPDDLIQINAGDKILFDYANMDIFEARSNADRFQNFATSTDMTDIWGFGIGSQEIFRFFYNETYINLVNGTWDNPSFNTTAYSDTWIEWTPDPATQTGVLTFLQDWPQLIGYTYIKGSATTYSEITSWDYNIPSDFFVLDQGNVTPTNYDTVIPSDTPLRFEPETVVWDFDVADLLTTNIHIKAGDYMTYNKTTVRNNVTYQEYLGTTPFDVNHWNFRSTGSGFYLRYSTGLLEFQYEGGTWDTPVLTANFSDSWIDWVVTGDVGVLTFLQDWENPLHSVRISTDVSQPRYFWNNSINLNTQATLHLHLDPSTLTLSYNEGALIMDVSTGDFENNNNLVEGTQVVTITMVNPASGPIGLLLDILPIIFVIGLIAMAGLVVKKKF